MFRITITPRRSLLALAAGLLAAGLLSASLAASASASAPLRHVTNNTGSKIAIVDDEPWPLSDEKATFSLSESRFPGLTVAADDYYVGAGPRKATFCVGDEVRVELEVRAKASYYFYQWVNMIVSARLYEGTDCNSTDLDGTATDVFLIGPGETSTHSLTVRNDDEGGDSAKITFNWTNSPA